MKDGKPHGFVRAITQLGTLYEGFMNEKCQLEGFGRVYNWSGSQQVGWWKEDKQHGNIICINCDGKQDVDQTGFYDSQDLYTR